MTYRVSGALDDRAREALRRYRSRAWLWVAGSLALFVLFVMVTHVKSLVALGIILGVAWIALQPIGVVGLLQVHKLRRHLKSATWTTARSRYASVQSGQARIQLLELDLPGRGRVVARAGGPYVPVGRPGLKGAQELQVALADNNYLVVRSHDSGVLIGARIPRTAKLEALREQQFARHVTPSTHTEPAATGLSDS